MVHPPVRVVEISSPFARFAGRILVGLGFEVILVEPPTGDPSRTESQGDSYLHWHAGKKSVVLDIDDSNDRLAFEALLRSADVLLDGSATGALRDNRGSLVHVRVTPFGTTGPRSDWKATNLTVAALGGMMAQVGDPEHPPLLLPELQAEQLAGINAAIGVLLGLRSRSKGHNPLLEISAQECVAAALEAGTLPTFTRTAYHRVRAGYIRSFRTDCSRPPTVMSVAASAVAPACGTACWPG
ncbi:CoA transferase [Rhodococcus sp. 1.20]